MSLNDILAAANQSVDDLINQLETIHPSSESDSSMTTEPLNVDDSVVALEQPVHPIGPKPYVSPHKGKPLPAIQFSPSDYSIKSMPNLNYSDSDEETVVQSPVQQHHPNFNRNESMKSTISTNVKLDTIIVNDSIESEEPTREDVKLSHQHKRSSSLSDFVGGIIRSFSSNHIQSRNFSSATGNTVFESAEEGYDEEDEDGKYDDDNVHGDKEFQNENSMDEDNADQEHVEMGIDEHKEREDSFDSPSSQYSEDSMANETIQNDTINNAPLDMFEEEIEKSVVENTEIESLHGDFQLDLPFEDDIFDTEFIEFNRKLNSRNSSNTSASTTSNRIVSIERGEQQELLNIWSKQKNYNVPIKKHVEFDSIHTPIKKSLIVNTSNPKSVHILNSNSIYDKLEVLPVGVKGYHHVQVRSVNDAVSDNESSHSVIKYDINDEPEELSLQLQDLTVDLSADSETSIQKEIANWDPKPEPNFHHERNKSSIDVLKSVWSENDRESSQLSNDFLYQLTHSDTFHRLNKKNIESYLYKETDFEADNVRLMPPPQHQQIYQFNQNESMSRIVPGLGISEGVLEYEDDDNVDDIDTIGSIHTSLKPIEFEQQQKSPISPAREKMIAHFQQQLRQKKEQESHRELQHQLQSQIHQHAKSVQSSPVKPIKFEHKKVNKSYDPNNDSVDDIFEEFAESPSKSKQNISHYAIDDDQLNPFLEPTPKPVTATLADSNSHSEHQVEQAKVLDGRLFLRIHDINSLKLPELEKRNAKFQLNIDNGIHCIKTEFISSKNGVIPIDKEFELIVKDKLDVIITIKVKYDKPVGKTVEVVSERKVKSKSKFGRLLGKTEVEKVRRKVQQPPEKDLIAEYTGNDGSCGKLKITFSEYHDKIHGKPATFSLTCFNEWKTTVSKSGSVVNKEPTPICSCRIQMLYIPKTLENETLPVSISNAMHQLKEVRKLGNLSHQGIMTQIGGDVKLMTRRSFKLEKHDLLAYNLENHKLKAKINLKKVTDILTLPNNEFIIKFANQETISFTCDTSQEREAWVRSLKESMTIHLLMKQPWLKTVMASMDGIAV